MMPWRCVSRVLNASRLPMGGMLGSSSAAACVNGALGHAASIAGSPSEAHPFVTQRRLRRTSKRAAERLAVSQTAADDFLRSLQAPKSVVASDSPSVPDATTSLTRMTTPALQEYFTQQVVQPQRAVMVVDGTALLHRLYFVFSRRRRPWWNAVEERLRELKKAEEKAARLQPTAGGASETQPLAQRKKTQRKPQLLQRRGRQLSNPIDAAAYAAKRSATVSALLKAERERLGAVVADSMSERELLLSAAARQVGLRGISGDPTFYLQQALGRFVSSVRRLVPPGVVPPSVEADGERLGLLRRIQGPQPLGVLADPQFLTQRQRAALAAWRAKAPTPQLTEAIDGDLISVPAAMVSESASIEGSKGKVVSGKVVSGKKDKKRAKRGAKRKALGLLSTVRESFIASLMGDHPEVLVEVAGDGMRERTSEHASPFLQRRVIFCFDVHTIFTPHRVELPYQRQAIVPAYKGQRFRSPFIAPFMAIAMRILRNMVAHGDIDACLPDASFDGIPAANGARYGVEADDLLLSCVRYYCQPDHPHQQPGYRAAVAGAAGCQALEATDDGVEPIAAAGVAVAPAVGWAQRQPHVVVLSHDKDLFQLLQYPRTHFYHFGYKRFVSPRDVATRYSGAGWAASELAPDAWRAASSRSSDTTDSEVLARDRVRQLNDYLTMCGDVADNVDGFPGVGTATALRLLARYGGVHGFLDAATRATAPPGGIDAAGDARDVAVALPPVRMERELLQWAASRREQILQSYSEVVGLLEVPGADAHLADVEHRALSRSRREVGGSPPSTRTDPLPSWAVEVARNINECFTSRGL